MKCSKHPANDAVASCNKCNCGVCKTCANATKELKESYGTLCIDCYTEELEESIQFFHKARAKLLNKIIISLVLYLIGAIAIIDGLTTQVIPQALAGAFFCGFYPAISAWKKAEEAHEEEERKHGISYTITSDGIYRNDGFFFKLFISIIGAIFGIIVTPINVIKYSIHRKQAKNYIEEFTADIQRVQKI